MRALTVVLKTIERCNLNCTYCYFFNGQDQSYKNNPACIKRVTIDQLLSFLIQGVKDLNLSKVNIALHGGEPLLQSKENFIYLCESLNNISNFVEIKIGIQTNGLLINEKWLKLFEECKIDNIGISIDGYEEINDEYRRDFFNQPTHKSS